MNRIFATIVIFAWGATAMAQTTAERKANLKSFIDSRNDAQTLQVEDALVPLGYQKLPEPPTPDPTPTDRVLVWSTTHETGNLSSSWNFGRQAVYNSGNGRTWIEQSLQSKSGSYRLAQSATMDGSSGARCFITGDGRNGGWKPLPKELIATTWLYLPTNFPWRKCGSGGTNWFNLQQLKERPSLSGSPVNPTIYPSISSDTTGPYLYIYNWIAGQRYWINQNVQPQRVHLPLGKWVKLEWYSLSKASGGATWLKQDDVLIIDRKNIKTLSSDNLVTNWSVNCYGGSAIGSATLYWDDCKLETPK